MEEQLQQLEAGKTPLQDIQAVLDLLVSSDLEEKSEEYLLEEAKILILRLDYRLRQVESRRLRDGNTLPLPSYELGGAFLTLSVESHVVGNRTWASNLFRMYGEWANQQLYQVRCVEKEPHYDSSDNSQDVGLNLVTVEFSNYFAYQSLLSEQGIHRLVKQASSRKPVYSSARVDVLPILDGLPQWEISPESLDIVVPGWPVNCNKIPTEVHVTHLPTGIKIICNLEQYQLHNRQKAISLLKSKLFVIAQAQGVSSISAIKPHQIKSDSNCSVIRDYLYDERKVKDYQTGLELSDLETVLKGGIDPFIRAFLRMQHASLAEFPACQTSQS